MKTTMNDPRARQPTAPTCAVPRGSRRPRRRAADQHGCDRNASTRRLVNAQAATRRRRELAQVGFRTHRAASKIQAPDGAMNEAMSVGGAPARRRKCHGSLQHAASPRRPARCSRWPTRGARSTAWRTPCEIGRPLERGRERHHDGPTRCLPAHRRAAATLVAAGVDQAFV